MAVIPFVRHCSPKVAPPGVTAHVVISKMIHVYNNPKYAGERVMLLFTNPTDVERLVEGGVNTLC
ncbi:PTS sugar transporter subunit IIB [Shigella flexneri]